MSPQQPCCCWPSQKLLAASASCSDAFPVCLASYCPATIHAVTATCCTVAMRACLSRCDSAGCLWPSTVQLQYGLPLAEYYPATVHAASASSALYCPVMVRAASGRVLRSCSAGCLWPSTTLKDFKNAKNEIHKIY